MKRLILISVLAAGCATPPPPPPPPPLTPVVVAPPKPKEPTAEQRFASGVKALEAKDWEGAQAHFDAALKKNDTMYAAWFDKAIAQEGLLDLDGAEKSYERVRALVPEHKGALLNLGHLYRLREQYDKAVALYKAALLKDPYDVQVLNNLVVCLRLARDYKEAESTVRRLLARAPRNADAYKNLSLIYYDQGRFKLAEFVNGNARKLDEKDPGIYNNLGMIYQKRGELALALAQFKKAAELNPEFVPAQMNVGAVALHYRDYKLAEKTFEKVVQLNPADYQAHLFYAYALEGNKKGKEALAEYDKVLAVKAEHPDAIFGIANVHYRLMNDPQQALEHFKKYLPMGEGSQKAIAEKNISTIENRLKAKLAAKAAMAEQEEKEKAKPPPPAPTGPSIIETHQEAETPPEGAAPAAPPAAEAPPAPPAADAATDSGTP